MRVLREVIIQRIDSGELMAVSQTAGVVGETLSLDVMGAGASVGLRVRVVESRPVIVDGSLRHRIRLALMNVAAEYPAPAVVQSLAGPTAAES